MAPTVTLNDQLCFALYGASMAVTRLYKPMLDRLGITYPQYLVLHVLWEDDGRSLGAIAQRLSLEPSTITPLVKRLEAADLVTRARHPDDDRSICITLTDKGRALQEESRCLGEALLSQTGMTMTDVQALKQQVQDLTRALEQTGED
ncbi:MarR family transcriptional regulator [Tianweitania sp. BSSL-BM11]|uniref:MarR family transcriptional regulator n=1 Tax=Tianweitania aestuarii TaxID=2814886 RepID=A0ABS5RZE1_9HYPH|nr:MarR family transcriptional regulator [Tianweitania aestuarii]MBS9722423.1 MarR family transcriptional regulator [Tianweitania aestuarii]